MWKDYKIVICFAMFALFGVTLACSGPQIQAKFIELQETMRELTTAVTSACSGPQIQAIFIELQETMRELTTSILKLNPNGENSSGNDNKNPLEDFKPIIPF
ncbi:uncharacterized protein LOC115065942 [Bactrocera dorsalis]|uniref:Uncharacterized protein LOC115065942 n=1 Tax=Bactrocera dorsalis TaxID=27457 RepID=A0A8N4KY33_BACDO|nr:uncharacterized protein LOC115065942 [Bactrocera dorsalis]